jgi:stage II sporulation protein D
MKSRQNLRVLTALVSALWGQTQRNWWLSLLAWVILIAPVQAAVELRVAIKKNVSQIKVGSSTPALVKDASGRTLGQIEAMDGISSQKNGSGIALEQWRASQIFIEPQDGGFVWIGDRWYRGRIRLMNQGQGLIAVNHVGLEQYLYSVVGSEAIPTWPLEALKAQAVAARTYAIYKSSTSGNRFYDLDTTTATQVYKGLEKEYVSTYEAVEATKGQIVTYNNRAILAAFHSSSGGHTENVEDVWSSPLPYLRGVVDYDQLSPVFQWTETFSANEVTRMIGGVGTIKAMIPEKTTPHGRIISMKIVGSKGTKRLSGTKLRQALKLKSTLFTVSTATKGTFQITGRGYGHGIGLSQWGTQYLAEAGVTYDQILAHYYQSASLSQLD